MANLEELLNSNILIVDDNISNVALLEDILEQEGYENFTSTTDPRMVMELCEEEQFDLILLDIRMPHLSGFDIMNMLREQTATSFLPILVLTAQTDPQTRKDALEAGAKDFLTKPFVSWEVLLRIRNMLETRYFYKRQVIRAENLEKEVRLRTQELRNAQLEIVRRLGRAGEYRDNETGAHVIRMSKISEILARGLGMDDSTCELVLHASPMHDVGKIAIPDSVLLKPAPLDEAEWEIMKSHAKIGAEILGGHQSEIMHMAAEMALSHHEKWDGTGYPQGLAGESIPLVARIAAVSDVFDALTSERPYKKAWSIDEAFRYLQEQSGKHFDPKIITLFCENIEAIKIIKKSHPDN